MIRVHLNPSLPLLLLLLVYGTLKVMLKGCRFSPPEEVMAVVVQWLQRVLSGRDLSFDGAVGCLLQCPSGIVLMASTPFSRAFHEWISLKMPCRLKR
jgi:hypothetical protein